MFIVFTPYLYFNGQTYGGAVSYADVTSANIVGFQQTEMKNTYGYNFIIPTFVDVGAKTATYDLQNVRLINADGSGYVDSIEVWDDSGSMTDEAYWWCTMTDCGVEDGWYTQGGDEKIENVKLNIGTGLYLNIATEGATVQYAGQVFEDEIESDELPAGYNVIGNPTPVKMTLQDLKLIGADGSGYVDSIEVWDDSGSMTDEAYWWCTMTDCGVEDGWYTQGGDEKIEGVDLLPGEGVFFNNATGEGVRFTLPNPMTYVYPTK